MQKFLMLLQMIPAIIAIVKQVEQAIPGQGRGKEKLDVVLNTVNAAAAASPQVVSSIENKDMAGAVTGITNAVVATLNAAGALKQPAETAPVPPTE